MATKSKKRSEQQKPIPATFDANVHMKMADAVKALGSAETYLNRFLHSRTGVNRYVDAEAGIFFNRADIERLALLKATTGSFAPRKKTSRRKTNRPYQMVNRTPQNGTPATRPMVTLVGTAEDLLPLLSRSGFGVMLSLVPPKK